MKIYKNASEATTISVQLKSSIFDKWKFYMIVSLGKLIIMSIDFKWISFSQFDLLTLKVSLYSEILGFLTWTAVNDQNSVCKED